VSAKWRPNERLGLSLVVREEMFGRDFSPIIPAFFTEYELSRRGNITLKGSISRNFRFPTLNDLYFLPGGNPDLKKERGWTYDAGVSFAVGRENSFLLSGSASWFDSYVKDWILWLATPKGFLSPRNVKEVHAYGVELKTDLAVAFNRHWKLDASATFSWTPSINEGEPMTEADKSVGKQLPYIPELSATLSARLQWRRWAFHYKWCYYSERYTMSSNDITLTGKLPDYYMSNISLEKGFSFSWADLTLKGCINNLFDEDYISVLSRPMPGINFEIFIGITPKWGKR
jgi:iron complex outermembrane receptor protein